MTTTLPPLAARDALSLSRRPKRVCAAIAVGALFLALASPAVATSPFPKTIVLPNDAVAGDVAKGLQ